MMATPTAVRMPKGGLSMEEGKDVQWSKAEGTTVREGENLPGHGGSFKEHGGSSLGGLADVVLEAVGQISAGPAHYVGHSLGAAVAVEIALRAPDQVRSLILITPPKLLGGDLSRPFLD